MFDIPPANAADGTFNPDTFPTPDEFKEGEKKWLDSLEPFIDALARNCLGGTLHRLQATGDQLNRDGKIAVKTAILFTSPGKAYSDDDDLFKSRTKFNDVVAKRAAAKAQEYLKAKGWIANAVFKFEQLNSSYRCRCDDGFSVTLNMEVTLQIP